MQITNSLQPSEYPSSVEKVAVKVEKPKAKVQDDSQGIAARDNSVKLSELTSVLNESNISLSFSQDETTKALVVRLVDKITGEEIRQIPTEVSLRLVAVNAKLQGNFVDKTS